MTVPRQLSDGRLRQLRQTAQLLHRPRSPSVADVVHRLAGIQAQEPFWAGLALRARSRGLTAADVARALTEERSIVRTWAMRGTLHLVTAEDFAWIVPLTARTSLPGAHRRLAQLGVPADQQARAVRLIERRLAAEGTLTRAEIAQRLRRRGIGTEGRAAIHLIRLAALEGVACYGPEREGEPAFVLVRDWLKAATVLERDAAVVELASRYVTRHAPTTPEDFATWSGLGAADVKRAWGEIGPRLVEVRHGTRSLWTPRRTPAGSKDRVVRLVPGFDPYLLGWKSREFCLPRAHEREVFPGGGMLRPTILVDGLAVGTWTVGRRGDPVRVSLDPFSALAPAVRKGVEADARDVGRFLAPSASVSVQWQGAT